MSHPAGWRTEQAVQEGIWYRYFLDPSEGTPTAPGLAATLLAGPLPGSLDDYAEVYLAGNALESSQGESRQGAAGRSYLYSSAGGSKRHRLLLLEADGIVVGLYAQGERAAFQRQQALLEQMFESLTLERPEHYAERRDERFGFAIGLPASWSSTRTLSGRERLAAHFLSPPLRSERYGQTVHASLTVSVEPLRDDGGLEAFYEDTRRRLGDGFQVLDHYRWKDGYADVVQTETPMSVSRLRRYYRVSGARGYTLSFEAREDIFQDVAKWFDLIASTFRVGEELEAPAASPARQPRNGAAGTGAGHSR